MILGLRTVIYYVPDLDAAKKWYTAAFSVAPYFDEPYYVGFNIGGFELGLHPAAVDTGQGKAAGVVAYWGVEDIEQTYRQLLEIGATEHEAIQNVGEGIRVAAVKDPFGNAVGIIQNPNFSPNAVR